MKIKFKNKKTEKICSSLKEAQKLMGKDDAKRLMDLLNIIESFNNLYDLYNFPQYNLHPLKGDRKYQYSLKISKKTKWRLVIYPLDEQEQLLKEKTNEKEMLVKAVIIEVLEVSEHYE